MVQCGVITLSLLCTQLLAAIGGGGCMPQYNYNSSSPDGPEAWGDLSPDWELCSTGQEQSPIAINFQESPVNQSLGRLNFTYMPSSGELTNTGHSIEVKFWSSAGHWMLGDDAYELIQFHFHAPSEHVIDGVRFPLELHLVHKTADGKIAVIGVLFWKSCHGHFLNQFWEKLPNVTDKGDRVHIHRASFENLHIGPSYAHYLGSLTTPPCTQNVTWAIELSEWNTVSQTQLDELEMILGEPNARPLQADNGREIEVYRYRYPPTPTSFASEGHNLGKQAPHHV